MKAMLLAAGFGTRLRPITWTLPKPIVPVCNRPMIAYAVDNLLRAGIDEIIVNLHHRPEAIESTLRAAYDGRCTFTFSHETEILGTGGAIRRVRPLLENEDDFFLANGDTIQFPRFGALQEARRAGDALAALTLRHPPAGESFTAVYFDRGRVTGFGRGIGEALMFSGCHCISSRIFGHLPEQEFSGIVEHVYSPVVESGRDTIAGVVDDGLWFDIGTLQRYVSASHGLREAMIDGRIETGSSRVSGTSIVDETAAVHGAVTRSTVGARSIVEGNLASSFVWDDCRIARGAKLTSCIVAHGVDITRPGEISNAIICRDDPAIPREEGYRFEEGLVIAPIA
jgi:NDP-sugar pyrophosphorylase family protein